MSARDSLERSRRLLAELEQSVTNEVIVSRGWQASLFEKTDNLFLMTVITTLVCLLCMSFLLVQEQQEREQIVKEQSRYSSHESAQMQTTEIPLGQFEGVSQHRDHNGNSIYLQYETFITTNNRQRNFIETESQVRQHENRLRSTVERVVNYAAPAMLNEPDLSQLRNRLVKELNRDLKKGYVQDVQFANFLHFTLQQ